jgi:hypothetical protein
VLLPRLRRRAGLKRRELVAQLAQSLGVTPKAEKVERYYHEMEQGLLPARGVADRVLHALAALIGSSTQALREAGRAFAEPQEQEARGFRAFARTHSLDASAGAGPPPALASELEPWDEVDQLFRGGG